MDACAHLQWTGDVPTAGASRRCRAGLLALAVLSLALFGVLAASASAATYSQTQTTPVPPASNFSGSAGGDGWDISLSTDRVYNVFHHGTTLRVACHLQSTAAQCWAPKTITEGAVTFTTPQHSGTHLDQGTGRLYTFGHRNSDNTAGVVCIDTAAPDATLNPFCGFTALTQIGQGGGMLIGMPMQVGDRFYAVNFVVNTPVGGATGSGSQNKLMCFDMSTGAACAGQPFSLDIGGGNYTGSVISPATAAIVDQLIIPTGSNGRVACFDTTTETECAGSWPIVGLSNPGGSGAPFPLMDPAGTITGFCLGGAANPCFTPSGATAPTPAGMTTAIGASGFYNGPPVVLGPRVYVPRGDFGVGLSTVRCYDYSTSAGCTNFPKAMANTVFVYTVNADPQRPSCLWTNADGGTAQLQSFDAYSGLGCGQGATRVLTSEFVVAQEQCYPTSYESLRVISPEPGSYTSGTVAFANGAGNPIPGAPPQDLDATGTADLTGLDLSSASGLPQFLITLNGAAASEIVVQLTWTAAYDPDCIAEGTVVDAEETTVTTSLSGGGQSGPMIEVPEDTPVTDTATLTGTHAGQATGTITYTWYSDSECTTIVAGGTEQAITTPGTLPDSAPQTLGPGTYHVVASYSGDEGNLSSETDCADEVLTVTDPTPAIGPACDEVLAPVACWRLAESAGTTAVDDSPYDNDGTYQNGVALGLPGITPGDTAARFDGSNDILRVPDSASLDFGDTFTAELWIKRSSIAKSHELLNKGGNGLHLVAMSGAGAASQVLLRKANVGIVAGTTTGIPADGSYHHIVATKNGLNSARIYIDGDDVTVPVNTGLAIQNTALPLYTAPKASTPMDIDQIVLYNRALTPTEVDARFARGAPLPAA